MAKEIAIAVTQKVEVSASVGDGSSGILTGHEWTVSDANVLQVDPIGDGSRAWVIAKNPGCARVKCHALLDGKTPLYVTHMVRVTK